MGDCEHVERVLKIKCLQHALTEGGTQREVIGLILMRHGEAFDSASST